MPTASLKYFQQILTVLSEFDISEEACLQAVGLSDLPNSSRVDSEIIARILNFASERLNDPLIGIRCSLKYPIFQYSRSSEFLKLSDNLAHVAELYNCYGRLRHTVGTSSCVISENGVDRMVWTPHFRPDQAQLYHQHVELILTNFVTSINWLMWKTPNAVEQLNLKHEPITPKEQYQDLFNCDVRYGQAEYSIVVKAGAKDIPFATADSIELAKARVMLDLVLNEVFAEENMMDGSVPNRAAVAEALGLSERTMGRALANKGTSFKDVKTRVLKGVAVSKINDGLSLAEIAQSLGYNDQPAFTRAYKKWFGYPPGQKSQPSKGKDIGL